MARRLECNSSRIGELVFQDSSPRRSLQLLAEVRFGIFELRVVPDRHPSLDLQISVYEGTTPASRQYYQPTIHIRPAMIDDLASLSGDTKPPCYPTRSAPYHPLHFLRALPFSEPRVGEGNAKQKIRCDL